MWLVPTRRRVSKLRNFLRSAIDAETETPGLLLIDHLDYTDNQRHYDKLEMPEGWRIQLTDAIGMGPKIREVWDLVKNCAWVGVLNDDHYIVTPAWDRRLILQLNGKNFITCNDRWNAPKRAAGATIFSMPLMEAFGFPMFPKQIDHLGIDDVFETIGKNTGCWEVDMSVIVEHHHAFKNQDAIDETHRAVYGSQPWVNAQGVPSPEAARTQAAFEDWVKNDAPGVVERVRKLRAGEQLQELPNGIKAIPIPGSGSPVPGVEKSSVSVRRNGYREVGTGGESVRSEAGQEHLSNLPGSGEGKLEDRV